MRTRLRAMMIVLALVIGAAPILGKSKQQRKREHTRGFSLIELLIVVAIILVIAAIAIPNFLRSRIAANQASAVSSLRVLNTAEVTYAATYNTGYASDLSYFSPPASGNATSTAAGLIDSMLASGIKSGYSFSYSPSINATGRTDAYTINADPVTTGTTGMNHYFTEQSGVIRQNSTAVASASDSPLAG